jgi:hypothetical protein
MRADRRIGAPPGCGEVTTWLSMSNQVLALREHLIQEQVTCVVLEATGDYWKPFVRHEAPQNRVEMKGPCRWSVAAGR